MRLLPIHRLCGAILVVVSAPLLGVAGPALLSAGGVKACSPQKCSGVHPDFVKRCPDGSTVHFECLEGPDGTCAWRLPPCPATPGHGR